MYDFNIMLENYMLHFSIAGGVFLLLIFWILSIELRLKKIFRGKKAKDLEGIMADISNEIKTLHASKEEMEKYLETVERRVKESIQNVGMIRFNPFENSGSNQSFAIALLNEKGSGVVISSLYSREKVNVYAKPINNYQSKYALSKEEKDAIAKSQNNGQ